jgi:hypothetical protein
MTLSTPEPIIERPPSMVDRLLISASVLDATLQGLRLGCDREMLCYWIGAAIPPDATGRTRANVMTVAFPRVTSSHSEFRLDEGQMAAITQWCATRGLWVLAQVHTHPTDEPHSEADECWPASSRPGFLSVVIPFFAQLSTVRDPHWRLHRVGADGRWAAADPQLHLEVTAGVWLPHFG